MNDWHPNPNSPQLKALETKAFEILMGGARGGSKTETGIVWMMKEIKNPLYRGLVIRKNADDLSDWVDRASRMYRKYGVYIAYRPAILTFPSGAIIKCGHLKDDNAYTKYQGHEYQRMLIEELTQIPEEKRYMQLLSSCRSTVDGLDARIFATTNPGGVGHGWVKKRFIDPIPPGHKYTDPTSGRTRIFIPSRVEDTPQLMEKDPDYVKYLDSLKDTDLELYKAWRLGDWDTFAGQYFREFRRDLHVMRPFNPNYKADDRVFIAGLDWGRAQPFAFVASVVKREEYVDPITRDTHSFYRVVTFKEVYGTDKMPKDWGAIIKDRVDLNAFKFIQADNQIYNPGNDNSMSIYEQFYQYDDRFRYLLKPASKERIGGWENVHNWLSIAPDGLPYWLITENCVNLIRTLPQLIHDENGNIEDVDTHVGGEDGLGIDHAPDAIRYMFKAFKWIDGRLGAVRGSKQPIHSVTPKRSPILELDLDAFAKAKVL